MSEHFTFRNEVIERYDLELYDKFIDCFQCMPICAVVNNEYLCMHGGISPEFRDLKDIDKLNRFEEPALSGLLCDLLWSDPVEDKVA
jgi:serine/threonine-protein phosphatase 2B catalytic subunit